MFSHVLKVNVVFERVECFILRIFLNFGQLSFVAQMIGSDYALVDKLGREEIGRATHGPMIHGFILWQKYC